jgi:hypothetical protein
LRGLEKAPTFLVPIINPPFADNSPHFKVRPALAFFVPVTLPCSADTDHDPVIPGDDAFVMT